MSVQVKYFASLRDRLGRAEDRIAASEGMSVGQVWAMLWPQTPLPPNTLTAVNMEYATLEQVVRDGRVSGAIARARSRTGRTTVATALAGRGTAGIGDGQVKYLTAISVTLPREPAKHLAYFKAVSEDKPRC